MQLTDTQRRRLAGRARTLRERLRTPAPVDEWTVEDPERWIETWRDRVADGDRAAFDRRLDRLGLSLSACRDRIRSNHWPADRPLPEWLDRVEDLLAFAARTGPAESPFEEERPFEEVLWTVVEYASDRLDPAIVSDSLDAGARTDLREWLCDRIQVLLSHPLFVEFKTFVAHRDRALVFGDPDVGSQREHYDAFVETVFDGGLRRFVLEYAFGARLLDTLVENWVDTVTEFCHRLDADRSAIGDRFGSGDPGRVVSVDPYGDPHCGGRAVLRVEFEDGPTVAYKPRDVGPEVAVSDLLSWFDRVGDGPDLEGLDCLGREGYGWVEWVAPAACSDPAAYYRRAGALTCLLYALNFTDGHGENVVAAGNHPVVVDLESVAQPDPDGDRVPGSSAVRPVLRESVLRTTLVPIYRPNAAASGASGFGSPEATAADLEVPEFTDVNTDVMDMQYREPTPTGGENLPHRDGDVFEPREYVDDLVAGFRTTYDAVLDHREEFLDDDGPLRAFEGVELRFLYRATSTYGAILSSTTTPEYLRTGLPFGVKAEALARPFVTGDADEDCWPVYEAELSALSELDVPRLSIGAGDAELRVGRQAVPNLPGTSPIDGVRERIAGLSVADREEQLDYLELGYRGASATTGRPHPPVDPVPPGTDPVLDSSPGVDDDAMATAGRNWAERIADRIRDHAEQSPDGDPMWIHREPTLESGVHLVPVDENLYQGRIGIALLFGALSEGGDDHEAFARRLAAPVYEAATGADPFADSPVGGCEGVGSIVYGLTKLGEILDAECYLDAAGAVARTLSADRFDADECYDVFGGSAGAILGLLAHYRATGEEFSLAKAIAAGDALLGAADDGPVWRGTEYDRWLAGFSHGSAGIAYALARLYDASEETRFRDSALDAVDRENRCFDPETRNWVDRRPGAGGSADAWCNGRTGVGLARLGTYESIPEPAVREDLDRALSGLDPSTLPEEDHLCCGTFGRVAFLHEAGRRTGDEAVLAAARDLAAQGIERGIGGFRVGQGTEHWYDPTLFDGEAGIGYELLRFRDPDLPCVLLWE